MAAALPDDLLHMVCGQLWEQRDFDTLYHCACTGKQLAIPALASIYRMHDVAPITSARNDEIEISADEKTSARRRARVFEKRVSMWKTIILSSMGKTLFPYSKYIRTLRVQDLEDLLDSQDPNFRDKIGRIFFTGDLAKFEVVRTVTIQKRNHLRLDIEATANRLTEVIIKQTPMLEELSGNIWHDVLSKSIPKLPNLQHLNVFKGEALEGTGKIFSVHCPLFKSVKFYGWQNTDADQHFATFLNDLRPQSLESFEIFSTSQIGAESFLALNCHRESLTELKLIGIKAEAMSALSMLKGCTKLTSLFLAENGVATQDLEKRHHDIFLEIIGWLCECKGLKSISMDKMFNAPGLLTPVLLENKIKLTRLELEGYQMWDSRSFHQALSHQTSLQSLWLKGESNELGQDGPDVDILVESLSKLENLTDLRLRDISDAFLDKHLCQLARSLPRLETWWTSGWGITDAIWADVASLHVLRRLELSAVTRFTPNGITNFILSLGQGNYGFVLSIMMGDPDWDMTDHEQAMIRECIAAELNGRFDFTLIRDPGEGYSDEEDSD